MEKSLKKNLRGIQRVPSLVFQNPNNQSLMHYNLEDYEICSVEPMHDLSGHIKNLLSELPHHLDKIERKFFENAYEISFGGRDNNRACDYRRGLIELAATLKNKISDNENLEILLTLIEIQRILYSNALERRPRQILQLPHDFQAFPPG